MNTVIVGSANPVKINAARHAFEQMLPAEVFTVKGVSVPSGVGEQPITDAETWQGARNRAQAAYAAHPTAAYTVGIEGGCDPLPGGPLSVFAWVVVRHADGRTGHGKTGTFFLPEEVAALVRGGLELGDADDRVFGQHNSKQQNGSIGLLTGNAITRTTYYTPAVVMALIPFVNTNLTFQAPSIT